MILEFYNIMNDFERLKKNIADFKNKKLKKINEALIKKIAVELLEKAKENTPVDTGNLLKNWKVGNVFKNGDLYSIEVFNDTDYASFVEYGHINKSGKWVGGRFMLTISEGQFKNDAQKVILSEFETYFIREFKI